MEAALRVEKLWDEISHKYALNTLCGYLSETLQGERGHRIFQKISLLHSTAVSANREAQLS